MALSPTNHTLTQGSSLRSPTLGYQKRKAMGFVNLQTSFALSLLLKWLSKAEGDGVRLSCKKTLPAPPLSLERVGGEALMLRLYSKLGIFLWFSLLFRIFHQT